MIVSELSEKGLERLPRNQLQCLHIMIRMNRIHRGMWHQEPRNDYASIRFTYSMMNSWTSFALGEDQTPCSLPHVDI